MYACCSRRAVLLLVATALVAAGPRAIADDPPAAPKKVTLAALALKGGVSEGSAGGGLFSLGGANLRDLVVRLEKAAGDEKIAGVILQMREPEIGLGMAAELRGAIAKVRQSGKKVFAEMQSASMRDYLVACACDQIVLPPSGELSITGVRAQVTMYKGLLDLLGIKADFIQIGAFKGAAEPLTRHELSPENRQQLDSVIGDMYEHMVETIAKDRQLEPDRVRALIDQGMFAAAEAQAARLIDRVCYEDELREQLKGELAADDLVLEKNYGKQKVDTDFSGFTGLVKLMELMMGVDRGKATSKGNKIAVIYAVGPIMTGESTSSVMGEEVMGAETIVRAFRAANDDATVKAIVLRIDSPGGSALASDLIWREVTRSKKPVVASMGDVAGSGGYYIAMGAKKIFAEAGTLTGSIGVIGGKLAMKGLFDKVGVRTEVISRGRNSGLLSSDEPFTDAERETIKKLMNEIYQQFTTKAAAGRKMELAKLQSLAGGHIYSGRQAVGNGLVDAIGTLNDALAEAKSLSGIAAEEKVEVLVLPKPKNFFEQLFDGPGLDVESRVLGAAGLGDAAGTVDLLRRLFRERVVTLLPYRVRID